MFKNLSQLASLMRNASEMSGRLESLNRTLQEKQVMGTAGGDMVGVEMNGLGVVTRVTIDPALISSGDREMLETLLTTAINQAAAKAKAQHLDLVRELAGGIDLPGLNQWMSGLAPTEAPETRDD